MEDISPYHPQKIPEDLKAYAREMSKKIPTSEQLLWYLLRNRRMAGEKFRSVVGRVQPALLRFSKVLRRGLHPPYS